jgi:glycerol-3-phosphate dehydrogenase (NAD(P)+)
MVRIAMALGARAETLAGLSGFGDLVLTCTSAQSRNFCFGQSLGAGTALEPGVTVEGIATAQAVARLADRLGVEAPVAAMVSAVVAGRVTLSQAIDALLSRPLKQE